MEIPILTSFINGLKLFFENKRLRWFTIVFFIGLVITSIVGAAGLYVSQQGGNALGIVVLVAITGGVWPVFFMLATFMTLIRLQRFVASDGSYKLSAIMFIPWFAISIIMLFMMATMFMPFFQMLIFGVAFVGWIMFQAYFSTRTALKYGGTVDTTKIPKGRTILAGFSNILCYVVIFGALIFIIVTNLTELLTAPIRLVLIIIGAGFAALFNFINSLIMARHRNKVTVGNLALIGLFISFYSAYFIYNAGKPVDTTPDLVSIAISIFFVIYTMSSVGSTLSGRSSESFLRVSADLAAVFTFFLASGYYFADVLFPIILPDPAFGASLSDIIKLMVFPFIAMIMEALYLHRIGKAQEAVPAPSEVPPEGEAEPVAPTPSEEPVSPTPPEEEAPIASTPTEEPEPFSDESVPEVSDESYETTDSATGVPEETTSDDASDASEEEDDDDGPVSGYLDTDMADGSEPP
ncbi:MAG: hypothetical protein K9W43_10835 [Candidatus Thorarchaeota archaeon]|nr:hypothetical protein [Candidatus Thorarchaeota archaeon]